jgi:hypothetical protein
MAAPKYYEGQEFVSDDPNKPTLVYRAGKFYPKQDEPAGQAGAADEPFAPLTPGSDSRARVTLGLGPSTNAQRHIYETEGWGKGVGKAQNPYNKHPIATVLGNLDQGKIAQTVGFSADPIARAIGGQEYQDYEQANKSFESAFLPILSGAAVTPTEAQRMIRANLPELGDTPSTLARKATNRAMMVNAAADLAGRPRPFAKVGTWDFKGTQAGSQPRVGQVAAGAPQAAGQVPPPAQRKAGQTYQTPRGPMRWTGTGWVH